MSEINVRINRENIDEAKGKANEVLDLLQQVKRLIGEVGERDGAGFYYICDPTKSPDCPKRGCQELCFHTLDPERRDTTASLCFMQVDLSKGVVCRGNPQH